VTTWSRRDFLKLTGATAAGGAMLPLLSRSASASESPTGAAADAVAKAHLGVFAEPDTRENYFTALVHFQDEISRAVDIYRTYRSWGQPILNDTTTKILDPNQNPYPPPRLYVSFHAFLDSKGNNCIPWAGIAAGHYDAEIDSWSDELLQIGKPAYISFNHEMENEEGTPPNGCGTPADFIAAYWYFRRRMAVVNGVPNLTWVITYMHNTFAPYLKHGGPDRWWPATSPYEDVPNDHLVGVDIYNRNVCHSKGWRTFDDLMNPVLQSARKQKLTAVNFTLGKNRKLFIGECGCVECDDCGGTCKPGIDKAGWFQDALTRMKTWTNLEAFCYSNVWGFNDGNYRIDTSPKALAAFQTLANDPYFTQ
jgi:TAT (twin-arginine translocation) pathway signal sequence